MEALPNGQTNTNINGVTENEVDFEFLPLIYEIIKSIERDPTHDTTQKPRDSQDTFSKILELEKKLNQAREQVNQLPGIEHSQAEQLRQVENLRKQLLLKRQMLNNEQLISKLADSYPMRRAAQFLVYMYNKNRLTALEKAKTAEEEGAKLVAKLKKVLDELDGQSRKLK